VVALRDFARFDAPGADSDLLRFSVYQYPDRLQVGEELARRDPRYLFSYSAFFLRETAPHYLAPCGGTFTANVTYFGHIFSLNYRSL
jgi:hypothetical protein